MNEWELTDEEIVGVSNSAANEWLESEKEPEREDITFTEAVDEAQRELAKAVRSAIATAAQKKLFDWLRQQSEHCCDAGGGKYHAIPYSVWQKIKTELGMER